MASLAEFRSAMENILSPEEVLDESSPSWEIETQAWSAQLDRQPLIALRPSSLESLQSVMKPLYNSGLDFAIRTSGTGSSSAKDVILSMSAFNNFEYNHEQQVAIVGAGQLWGDVDRRMQQEAPGYAVVGARCPFVGVAGSVLHGGISWLSHEHGLSSDPKNLLDAQIVLADGRAIWASEEPDILWGLRGAGGNFGAVTAVKLKAHPFPSKIWCGNIWIPMTFLKEVSNKVSWFSKSVRDPRVAMHVYFTHPESPLIPMPEGIGLMVYDGNGEEHGRSQAFKWALELPGANAQVMETPLFDLHQLTAAARLAKGKTKTWSSGALISEIDEGMIERGWEWFDSLLKTNKDFATGSFFLVETMQEGALGSSGGLQTTAWPHSGHNHVLQLGVGFDRDKTIPENQALELLQQGTRKVAKKPDQISYLPNFQQEFMDLQSAFGENWEKLRAIKAKFDPKARFNKGLYIPPAAA